VILAIDIILKLRKLDRVVISTAIRNELHGLPIDQRIIYELSDGLQMPTSPASLFLSSLCAPLSSVKTRRHMRAATQDDLNFPRTRTVTFGSHAFAVSGPTCWNSAPIPKIIIHAT